jgi:hypothetical protein
MTAAQAGARWGVGAAAAGRGWWRRRRGWWLAAGEEDEKISCWAGTGLEDNFPSTLGLVRELVE